MENATITLLKEKINQADALIIGAGSGLSTAAGFTYSGERFRRYFADFEDRYHFHDMYTGGFYPFESLEEYWAYWSRFIHCNRYMDVPHPEIFQNLKKLTENKDYFIITTNVDHLFQKHGFDKERLFYTQGDYGLWQCMTPCHPYTYDNEALVKRMVEEQKDMQIPTALIPRCPICGKPMTMNLRADHTFVEDAGWHRAAKRYEDFLQAHRQGKVVYLELGVGYNTPVIIKYAFWRFVHANKQATYACVNLDPIQIPEQIRHRSIALQTEIGAVLRQLGGERL